MKEILIKLLDDGKTLLKILDVIRQMDNIVQPRKNQVESFIKAYRKARFGAAKMTVQQFVDWAIAHSDIPDDIDKAFVLAYEHSPLGDDIPDDVDETTIVPWIRIIVSTKRLLANSSQSKIIHADGTYKLNIQKYPVLVFGTTDLDSTQHFHLLALMLCKTEATDDFEFGFKAIQNAMEKINKTKFEPDVLMADAAHAIHNGCKKVFAKTLSLECVMCT